MTFRHLRFVRGNELWLLLMHFYNYHLFLIAFLHRMCLRWKKNLSQNITIIKQENLGDENTSKLLTWSYFLSLFLLKHMSQMCHNCFTTNTKFCTCKIQVIHSFPFSRKKGNFFLLKGRKVSIYCCQKTLVKIFFLKWPSTKPKATS